MCRPAPCPVCQKTTWEGCGQHVDQVKAQVPADRWCPGHTTTTAASPSASPSTASTQATARR